MPARTAAALWPPQRRVPVERRELPRQDHRDQRRLGGRGHAVGQGPLVDASAWLRRLPLGHQRGIPGVYLTVDYSTPGQIVEFDRQGRLLWRYDPASGPEALNQPSLCEPISTIGDIPCKDDHNDRMIVVDLAPTGSSGSTATTAPPAAGRATWTTPTASTSRRPTRCSCATRRRWGYRASRARPAG